MNYKTGIKISSIENESETSFPSIFLQAFDKQRDFFSNNDNKKLCFVLPSKEQFAQWLAIPLLFETILTDYEKYKEPEIHQIYNSFRKGQKVKLNNSAVVEYVGIKKTDLIEGPSFKTKDTKNSPSAIITLRYSDVTKLQPVDQNSSLSSYKKVKTAFHTRNISPLEKVLNIDTFGNNSFVKNHLCLVGKLGSIDETYETLLINKEKVSSYFDVTRINETGEIETSCPGALISSNQLTNPLLFLEKKYSISKLIVDGFKYLTPKSDFFDVIKQFNVPIILITDYSELQNFTDIEEMGFKIVSFTKKLNFDNNIIFDNSPFKLFYCKYKNYLNFNQNLIEIKNDDIQKIHQEISNIKDDNNNDYLLKIKIAIIKIFNRLTRICYKLDEEEVSHYKKQIEVINILFQQNSAWLGESNIFISNTIDLLYKLLDNFKFNNEKEKWLTEVLLASKYNHIICYSEDEKIKLNQYYKLNGIKVSALNEVLEEKLSSINDKCVLIGWPKYYNYIDLITNFNFAELTCIFYEFEKRYLSSLTKKLKTQISVVGEENLRNLFKSEEAEERELFDIITIERDEEKKQYLKYFNYKAGENRIARRIDFGNKFIYATDSHKFLVLNELIKRKGNPKIYRWAYETLKTGDFIAFINTDRDILAEIAKKEVPVEIYEQNIYWVNLWKDLLQQAYAKVDYNTTKLAMDLKKWNCEKQIATIRNWLNDENMIGPEDDKDLIVIARYTKSEELLQNIATTRRAIKDVTGWRMRAADYVREKIKIHLLENYTNDDSFISIPDFGKVEILKIINVSEDTFNVDIRYINKLLNKEYDS